MAQATTRAELYARIRVVSAMLDNRQWSAAETNARELIRLDPGCARAYRQVAFAMREQGRSEEAEDAAREACRLAPNDAWNLLEYSRICTHLCQGARAVELAQRAVELAPTLADAHRQLAQANLTRFHPEDDTPSFDPAAALVAADEAIRLNPHEPSPHTVRGTALAHLGRKRAAAPAYRSALELNPDNPTALNNLGWVFIERRPIRSAALLAKSIGLWPESQHTRENLTYATQVWLVRVIRTLMWSGVALVGVASLVPVRDRLAALVCVGVAIAVGTVALGRALPRRSVRHVWLMGGQTSVVLALGVAGTALIDVTIALGSAAIATGCAVILAGGMLVTRRIDVSRLRRRLEARRGT
jgi:Tfp pilus assembly protein PilF